MDFPSPLLRGRLIKRYKRFLCDVELEDGTVITATCANTGSMKGLVNPGATIWLSESDNPTRKYRHTWEMVEHDAGTGPTIVGINTGHPNRIVSEAIEAGRVAPLIGYETLRREVKYGQNSRIDILLRIARRVAATSRSRTCISCATRASRNSLIQSPAAAPSTWASSPTWFPKAIAP